MDFHIKINLFSLGSVALNDDYEMHRILLMNGE